MALNYSPRPAGNTGPQSPAPTARPVVHYQTPSKSSARVDALKAKLTNKPAPNPIAPRRAGSSARAEQFASQPKYQTGQPIPQPAKPMGRSSARQAPQDLATIAPPPSGLAPGSIAAPPESLAQTDNSIEAPQETEAPSQPLSPQFVALAKEAKANRRARQQLEADKAAFQQERAGYIKKSDLEANTLKVLAESGITPDRLVDLQLNQVNPDPNQVLLDRIAELEGKLNGVNEQFTQRDTQAYETAVNQIRNDAQLLVDSDPAFETIKFNGANGVNEVVELIKGVFNEEGVVLPVEEAAKLVEEKMLDREYQRYQRLTELSKIKSRMAPPAEIPAEANQTKPQPKVTTLTNNGAAPRPLTARERAIQAVERRLAGE